ncbi:MAG: hypothetical protein JSW27_21655 [Phycisphaerales bacterium]|nr:MAG: hypothetical protein JSW27_21655 [Phycisphaerales bacterium]
MFFARKKVYETVATVMVLLIPVGVLILLNLHIPLWASAIVATAVLAASVWSGS